MDSIPLTIYHSNDMHARVAAMSKMRHLARRLRAADEAVGIKTLFWDAGDAADCRHEVCSLTRGAAFSDLLNAMGIELQTVRNDLSLTYGPQVLEACAERADFPIMAANLRNGEEGELVAGVEESVQIEVAP